MFYCNPCGDEMAWPTDTLLRSFGPCECCSKRSLCNEVPSSMLPVARRERAAESTKDGTDE